MQANIGKLLIALGALLIVLGLVIWGASRFVKLGQLPGDIHLQRGRTSFYFPLATSILVSILASLLLNLLIRWRGPK